MAALIKGRSHKLKHWNKPSNTSLIYVNLRLSPNNVYGHVGETVGSRQNFDTQISGILHNNARESDQQSEN